MPIKRCTGNVRQKGSRRGFGLCYGRWLALFCAAAVFASSLLWGGGARAEPLRVVATTGMIADAAEAIGGPHVAVKSLMGPGVDPHGYRQTRSDIVATSRADLVLRHGLYLEAQLERFFEDLKRRVPVVSVAENTPVEKLLAHDAYADKFDPHIWMDPKLWSYAVIGIRDALTEAAPDHEALFAQNTAAYLAELDALNAYGAAVLETVPETQRVLVTAHDAFSYFGRAFGFEVLGIQGISTESEAGLNRIGTLVDRLVDGNVGAVFVETSVSDRNMWALVEGTAARGHVVRVGGELFSDAMGPPGTYEGTYFGMIDHNMTTIANALGGDAPEHGRTGRLVLGGRRS